ncbi:MAG TPA: TonB-dependent receptor, partial [Verrucomicrobiae bacterium]|nr:TonB-dependent receptor [Verrucomicrobiae bacterium]
GVELRETQTNEDGSYRVDALLPGTYSVKVSAPGFAELEVKNVEVRAAQIASVNGTLEVQAQTATVVVEAGVGQELQTQSGDLSGNLTSKEIQEIPLGGLNPIALVLTQPGVVQPAGRDDFTNGVGFSVNGTRPRGNNFLIDGQDNNDLSITGQAFQPTNLEAYSEVKIVTNAYSAEFGRGGGSVTNVVTRGGTNEFHGSAWNLFRNSALKANDASNKPPAGNSDKPVEVQNTFGFSFGGPAIKDKLFLFGSSQWDRFRSTATDATLRVPTDAGVAVLQSLLPNPRVQALLDGLSGLRGDPTLTPQTIDLGFDAEGNSRPGVETGLVSITGLSQFSNSYEFVVRGDYLPTIVDTISVRYLQSRQT